MFIKSYINKYKNLAFRKKNTNDWYVENGILLNLRDFFSNITCMLNILLAKFKCNIETYNLNENKSYTNQSHLTYSWVLPEISILRMKINFLTPN